MIYITIINTIAIIYLLFAKKVNLYFEFKTNRTSENKVLTGYRIILWKRNDSYSSTSLFVIKIPIRNAKKLEISEEVNKMIHQYSYQSKLQTLSAKFSWLNTWEQVKEFEKNYECVEQKIVQNLVRSFKPKAVK